MAAQSVLLIDRGDLPSLVAATLEPDPSRMVLWHCGEADAGATGRSAAAKAHAEAMGARRVILTEPIVLGMQDMAPAPGLFQTGLLVQAAVIARQIGCSKVVWPYHVGADAERVGEAVDRANLVATLAQMGPAGQSLMIDLPLIDLVDEKLVDLADDSGAPLWGFWPCDADGSEPCGSCRGCGRWQRAFENAKIAWPWEVAPA